MKRSTGYYLFILLLFFLLPSSVTGQSKSKDMISLEKKADKLFRQQSYVLAKDLYSTLLSNNPKDPFYSFRFGVCLLYGDRRNLEKPLQYLELAAKAENIDKEVYYYLGQAYHFNYRFTDAIRLYQKYRGLVSDNKAARKDVDRQIEMCQNGLYLLSRVKELYVLEKKEVKSSDFYRNYDLSQFGGEILQQPAIFKSKLDLKKGVSGLVFFPKKQDIVLYSSYGLDGKNGKDIYYSLLLPDMTWTKPRKLPGMVNTPFDEDYPYLLPDGQTLYFASKGHNSMGGYDIFKSTYDTIKEEWRQPENLDFAINTPFDDELFVTDPYQHYAYFASNRSSVNENIMVYMVRIDKRPDKIQEISLDVPLAGAENEAAVSRSISIIKELADLPVNAGNENFKDSIVAYAVAEVVKPKPKPEVKEEKPAFESTLSQKVREKETLQQAVDSAFLLVNTMEESVKRMDKTVENLRGVSYLTTDRKQKDLADKLADALSKESGKKHGKLSYLQSLSANIQQYAATGKTDSVKVLYRNLKDKITKSDTVGDYQALVINTLSKGPVTAKSRERDDFLADFKPMKSAEEKERLDLVFALTDQEPGEITFETKVITPKEEEEVPQPDVAVKPEITENKEITQKQEVISQISQQPEDQPVVAPGMTRKPEIANRILNTLIAQKDSLNKLLVKTQRQKILLLSNALDKSNESGTKHSEIKKLQGVLETVITEGSARDLKNEIRSLKNEASGMAEEAVLDYSLASKLGEREKTIENALHEVESRAIIIEKTLDSGKVEKAAIMLDILVNPIRDFVAHSNTNDDILAATHRHARELKISVLTNFKQARQLSISSKASLDLAANLRRQAESHRDKNVAKKLIAEAETLEKQAAERQSEALEIFNQNIIWQNRSKALENSLPKSRGIIGLVDERVGQTDFRPPKKKIKDTTLLIPVMLDLLSNMLPESDTAYEKLANYRVIKNQPQPQANVEILRRTEFAANVDDQLLATQQKNIRKVTEPYVIRPIDNKELEIRERLAMLNDTVGNEAKVTQNIPENSVITQWETDKPSFILLKNQVDTLYTKVKKQPQLRLPSTLKGLFEELTMLTDSMSQSFNNYRKAKIAASKKQDTARIAMSLELEAFEVKATINRLKYLVNRLSLGELASASSNPEINARPQPDSVIAVKYFYEADLKREEALLIKDRKKSVPLLRQADELEKKGLEEQQTLARTLKEAPQQAIIALNSETKVTAGDNGKEINTVPTKTEEKKSQVLNPDVPVASQPKSEKKPEILKGQETVKNIKDLKKTKPEPKPQIDKKTAVVKKADAQKPVVPPVQNPVRQPVLPENTGTTASMGTFVSKFVDKPLKTLNSSEIASIEKEVQQASQQMKLPLLPGLMYSVQVGVYKAPRTSAQLFNINPLFEDIMLNGNYRYFSGIFGDRNDAVSYKNLMVEKGVNDAFVVIFYKGKKITSAEAASLVSESITSIIGQSRLEQLSKQPLQVKQKVYFSVQLAAYRRPLTAREMDFYTAKVKEKVTPYQTESGMTVLLTGEYADYNESLEARKVIVDQGITDAFIIGFVDGKRVMAYQARAALNPVP